MIRIAVWNCRFMAPVSASCDGTSSRRSQTPPLAVSGSNQLRLLLSSSIVMKAADTL
jgi:hypothetical protein